MSVTNRLHIETIPLSQRPLLIFNHNAKAGGGSILEVLRDAFECEVQKDHNGNYDGKLGDDVKDDAGGSCFLHVRETSWVDHEERQKGFVIGSVREPCSHYLSMWSFSSSGHGGKEYYVESYMGMDPPYFNTSEDVGRFREYVRDPVMFGHASKQFLRSYYDTLPGGQEGVEVDCWVYVDDLQNSLLGCLEAFEEQGGRVNWDAKIVSDLVKLSDGKDGDEHARALAETDLAKLKNDPFGNPQVKHHSFCDAYFDEGTASKIETGPDSVIYNAFGYEGCCKGRAPPIPNNVAAVQNSGSSWKAVGESGNSLGSGILLAFLFVTTFALGAFINEARRNVNSRINGGGTADYDHLNLKPSESKD